MTDIRSIIAQIPAFQQVTSLSWEAMRGGLSNTSYMLTADGTRFVLRTGGMHATDFGVNRQNEIDAQTLAAKSDLAPDIVWADADADILVTRYIEGTTWSIEQFAIPEVITQVAGVLRRVHALPVIDETMSLYAHIEHRLALARQYGIAMPEHLPALLDKLAAIHAENDAIRAPVLCHGDPFPDNFIKTEEHLYLIDWEFAGMGDPYADLAAATFFFDDAQRELMLQAYFGHVTDLMRRTMMQMHWVFIFKEVTWAMLQAYHGYTELDYTSMVRSFSTRLVEMLPQV